MRVVIALGGNAMTSPDGSARPEDQIAAIHTAMAATADLIAAGHEVVVTHGNGPQVGNLLVKNELAAAVVPPVPLDWCGAQTQGTIGFTILDELEGALAERGCATPVAALVSRTRVDADDQGFTHPSKPIGRYVSAEAARTMIDHGQTWEDRGERGWRRVVASPEPREFLEAGTVRTLLSQGYAVVGAVSGDHGRLRGVEAVIDKDLTACLLARSVDADVLVIATDVANAAVDWGTPTQRDLRSVTVAEMRAHAADGQFASGSMGPKVEAALRFVEAGGPRSVITSLDRIGEALEGRAGTVIANPSPAAGSA
jgi:carbamate kinase